MADSHLSHHRAIGLSTYGILFFGTPHLGINQEGTFNQLLRLFATQPSINDNIRANLQRTSEMLQLQLEQYVSVGSQFKTVFFYESVTTPTISGADVIVSLCSSYMQSILITPLWSRWYPRLLPSFRE